MNKKIIIFLAIALSAAAAYSQELGENDNVYGDYLISASKKVISVDLENAVLLNVVKLLSQQTGFNFIAVQSIQAKTFTLYLDKTPLKEAMDIIFKANNLAYDYYPQANIFVIKDTAAPPSEVQTKTYYLKYTRIYGISSVSSSSSGSGSSSSAAGTSSSGSSSGSGSSLGSFAGGEASQIVNAVQRVLSAQGKVGTDPVTNSLIVTDIPSQFSVIEQVIASIDVAMPQVMIEVEVLDVSKSLVDQVGTRLGSQDSDGTVSLLSYSPAARLTSGQINPANAATPTMGTLDFSQMKIALQLFSQDTTTRSLARPRILTLNNEPAEVNLTVDEVIGVQNNLQSAGQIGTSTNTAERAQTGVQLHVTPQINSETGEITMVLEVINRESKASSFAGFRDVEERGTKNLIRLKTGETLLIGGLIKQETEKITSKTPFLGDIPFLGKAFRYRNDTKTDRELLVFLTPKIVQAGALLADGSHFACREQPNSFKSRSMSLALDKTEIP
jgi:type IV pilus assembly protein PilQ